jgi:hypothetical protein
MDRRRKALTPCGDGIVAGRLMVTLKVNGPAYCNHAFAGEIGRRLLRTFRVP